MEYRYPASRRVADSLVSLFPLLVSALMVAGAVRFFSDPSANSHGTRRVVESVIFVAMVLLPGATLPAKGRREA